MHTPYGHARSSEAAFDFNILDHHASSSPDEAELGAIESEAHPFCWTFANTDLNPIFNHSGQTYAPAF